MKSFQFTWQIANYSSRATDTAVKSRPFVVSDEESSINFVLSFYPVVESGSENDENDDNSWSGLYLNVESKVKFDGNYHIELAILDAVGKKFHARQFHRKIPFPNNR